MNGKNGNGNGSSSNGHVNLGEAAANYIASLPVEEREASQPEVNRFMRWYGRERSFDDLAAPEVAAYAERLSLSDTDYMKKLDYIRGFLTYAKKEGLSKVNLAVHLKPKKSKAAAGGRQGIPESVPLTEQGYTELHAELIELKSRRPQSIAEITKAAADKDFRENAPLDAARENHGHLEGRIKELEAILKCATVVDRKPSESRKVNVGDTVVLVELDSCEEMCFSIVNPRETDPSKGKISGASPVGKAIMGHLEQEVVEVLVPVGKLRYQIKQIKH